MMFIKSFMSLIFALTISFSIYAGEQGKEKINYPTIAELNSYLGVEFTPKQIKEFIDKYNLNIRQAKNLYLCNHKLGFAFYDVSCNIDDNHRLYYLVIFINKSGRYSYLGEFDEYKGELPFGVTREDNADTTIKKLKKIGKGRIEDKYWKGTNSRCISYYTDKKCRYEFEFSHKKGNTLQVMLTFEDKKK